MTTCAATEHIGGIEREARTYKERARCCTHDLPYKIFPKIMTVYLMESVCKWLNAFPGKTGVSKTISPSTIVEGKPKPNMNNKHIVFGSYAIAYTGTTNNMRARGVPSIALKSSNDSGGHYFMNLYTGRTLHSYK